MALQAIAMLTLGLRRGSGLNVAVFAHPTLNRLPLETHILVRASFARLLGRRIALWMAGSTILNLYCYCSRSRTCNGQLGVSQRPSLRLKLSRSPSRSLGRCRSTSESSDGRRSRYPTIGKSKNIAGTYITGCA